MKIDKMIEEYGEKKIKAVWSKSKNKTDFVSNLGISYFNGTISRFIAECKKRFKLDEEHFDVKYKQRKYEEINKICTVCFSPFTTLKNNPREQVTCSYSCSNKFFRKGENNPNWKDSTYRTTCFEHHEKRCVVCDESNIVSVHHMDEDHDNNDQTNLIPLCPTHHQYMHSRYKHLIIDKVQDYINNFIGK